MKTIHWGIIGLGKIAHKFAQDLSSVPGASLHAVASRSGEKAAAFAEKFGVLHVFDNYENLLNCNGLDVVYIATPHVLHYENTLMCLRRGIPVLCEKPFAMNRDQVLEMVKTARTTNTFLMEAMWTRFFPLIERARVLIDAGEIGQVRTIRADFGFHAIFDPAGRVYNKSLGGGALLDVGIYPVFLTLLILGKPKTIAAQAVFSETGVDESCSITFTYDNQAMAQLYASVVTQTDVDAWIYGTTGRIHLHSRFHHPRKLTYGAYYSDSKSEENNYPGNGYQFEIEEVTNCLRQGKKESARMPLSLSLDLIELLEATMEAVGIRYF